MIQHGPVNCFRFSVTSLRRARGRAIRLLFVLYGLLIARSLITRKLRRRPRRGRGTQPRDGSSSRHCGWCDCRRGRWCCSGRRRGTGRRALTCRSKDSAVCANGRSRVGLRKRHTVEVLVCAAFLASPGLSTVCCSQDCAELSNCCSIRRTCKRDSQKDLRDTTSLANPCLSCICRS